MMIRREILFHLYFFCLFLILIDIILFSCREVDLKEKYHDTTTTMNIRWQLIIIDLICPSSMHCQSSHNYLNLGITEKFTSQIFNKFQKYQ